LKYPKEIWLFLPRKIFQIADSESCIFRKLSLKLGSHWALTCGKLLNSKYEKKNSYFEQATARYQRTPTFLNSSESDVISEFFVWV